ncbi:putative mitochondrial hypothetical protein [Leptomonas pyrrhocoris]|uniref:WD repeat-containing protein 54 beta-propeller domain-containing protein n=1 Tax=Leptomonas pyrrhocoris TaxID=157538 RepID=A0A0N0DY97_LEPPY|nr:putative mitochondrial hypothetical protein [Leptomonas pyrrhocoris]XP_015662181.1 putative mitochondrial hypothetical protein [Leptomonas pyrrhocoris]XP_015662182.1 putative mitochondrial hypothetical protein [Leptomonas pyrrhocoris]KPA83741.1 putative mitochondrial hypothetical protein [Leptomonas pyrrhocoris]KPA83742.1 putative mitochondrial hypothetical protein [Leptomonas pyrrhocoris]KPA83743.1 putative mitochondrial hypothetical protein [Leptomonas pyrrhocoris]|eukprot:XP_015662180.1 putative mitochondrial hypothetical protein [Leptomonas pyrrhocoris]
MSSSSLTVYQEVALPTAPALLYNNIVVHRDGDYVSYASPTAVVSVQTATGAPCFPPLELPAGTYAQFLAGVTDPAIENITLVAALSNRTAIVVVNGQQTHSVDTSGVTETYTCAAMTRVADTEAILLVLGGSEGSIDTVRCTPQGRPISTTPPSVPVQAHEHCSITALDVNISTADSSKAAEMVSGDSAGHVVLWRAWNPTLTVSPPETTDAVTAVKWLPQNGRVAVAYGGGQIKIVERESGAAAVVIQAHSRWINAMAYNAARQLLVSAAEDGHIFVWDANATDPDRVCVARGNVSHELLTGVAMIGTHGVVALLSYDVRRLRLMSSG